VLLGVERGEEALAEFERAIALYDGAGHQATTERFEVIRMAALAELHVLDRTAAAQGRLDAAIAEADAVGHADAASILRRLRAGRR
jgi:hypothetical protein